ncbi:MAG: hypothetical protein WDA25_01040 [Paracoccaceae bacterium]
MDAKLIHDAGQALYGTNWTGDMARALGVNIRTTQRWAADEITPPPGIWSEIAHLIDQRSGELDSIATRLKAASATP